jgi:hypothetical protein
MATSAKGALWAKDSARLQMMRRQTKKQPFVKEVQKVLKFRDQVMSDKRMVLTLVEASTRQTEARHRNGLDQSRKDQLHCLEI